MNNRYNITVENDEIVLYSDTQDNIICTKNPDEIKSMILLFNKKINFLKTVLAASEDPEEVNESVRKKENPRPDEIPTHTIRCNSHIIDAFSFDGGMCKQTVHIGNKALINERITSASLMFESCSDIYYGDELVVSEGDGIPYFSQVQTWETGGLFSDGKAKIVFDLRPHGVYGSDFKKEMLNDGIADGASGFNLNIKAIPTYKIPL